MTVLLPAPDGPDTTINFPQSLIVSFTSGISLVFAAHSSRDRLRLYGRKNDMPAVHDNDGSCPSSVGCVNELPSVAHIKYDSFYRRRFIIT
jgi:hypothetical protein